MKKLVFIFTLLIGAYYVSYAQTPSDIYSMFSGEKNVVALDISGSFGKMMNLDDEFLKNVESVTVLVLNDCVQSLKDKFSKEVGSLNTDGYETLIRVNRDDKTVKVLAKGNDDVIKEMLVVVSGQENVLVVVKGTMSRSELMSKSENLSINI